MFEDLHLAFHDQLPLHISLIKLDFLKIFNHFVVVADPTRQNQARTQNYRGKVESRAHKL